MAKYRILYCFIALCLALFYIFCYSYVPLLVIIVFAVVTVFSLAVSIFSARKISIEIKASHPVAEHGEDVNVEFMVTVTNKSFFPVSILGFSSEIQDLSEQGIIKRQYITGVSAKESREVYIFAKTEHCSYIECRVNNVFVCDAFGLVKYKLKSQNCKAHTTVVPSLSNDTYIMPDKLILSYDSDKYSDTKKDTDSDKSTDTKKNTDTDKEPDKKPTNPDKPKDPTETGTMGDIDGDGKITSADSLLILRQSVSLEHFTDFQQKLADVDGDGKITSADALEVLRYSVSLPTTGNIGKTITN